ncbi:LOW QUALITY PROTEIN: zinc finger protein 385D-like [Brienomyrus brachyistius]|uniref:LOW QUALITY PROTEIN: zinc finger protein 385D-like n=1 Tax=Brienomyrus brachyistius TaxID=42636 RepID=UPI0020B1A419|nr:LOW QUALITY PROTEIN: zinc finger protein 385D-like [Brienomyrus brachyistius]
MKRSMYFGNAGHSGILPALLRPPLPAIQPSLEMKQLLPFPLDATVSLFPSFSTMDPVQKAIINHTFGLPLPPKRKPIVVCSVCRLKFNSESQASAHYKGTKHAKKLKALEAPSSKQKVADMVARETPNKEPSKSTSPGPPPISTESTEGAVRPASPMPPTMARGVLPASAGTKVTSVTVDAECPTPSADSPHSDTDAESETEEEKAKRLLYCSLCKVAVNSQSQLEAHNSGTKHKTMLEARSGGGVHQILPRPGLKSKLASPTKTTTGLQNKTFHCEVCDVHVNSETQLKQHISSRRHKDRAAGKPAKPKYSPYSKPQRGPGAQTVRLSLRKGLELGKPLTARLLPSHLAAAAAAAATLPAFSLRSAPAAALFQAQPLPQTLLRPAPGPIRTAHGPVLFAPY